MCNKKSENPYKIPYALTITYEHPPVDSVPTELRVDVPMETEIISQAMLTVEEASAVYLEAFNQKFHSQDGRRRRQRSLLMFQHYLTAQGHSLRIADLTTTDGQGFLDSLTSYYDGMPLKDSSKLTYCNALRSFSRFLHHLGVMEENVFLRVKIER
jgi:site-specific recombinase XerD